MKCIEVIVRVIQQRKFYLGRKIRLTITKLRAFAVCKRKPSIGRSKKYFVALSIATFKFFPLFRIVELNTNDLIAICIFVRSITTSYRLLKASLCLVRLGIQLSLAPLY